MTSKFYKIMYKNMKENCLLLCVYNIFKEKDLCQLTEIYRSYKIFSKNKIQEILISSRISRKAYKENDYLLLNFYCGYFINCWIFLYSPSLSLL